MTIRYRDSSRNAKPTDAEVLDAAYRIVSSIEGLSPLTRPAKTSSMLRRYLLRSPRLSAPSAW